MKFALSVPDRLIPAFLKADRRALEKFKAENAATVQEMQKAQSKGVKRVSINLTKRRQFKTEMQQDNLKLALEWAKDPQRPRRDMLYPMYDEVWNMDGHTIGETRKAILKAIGSPFGVFKVGSEEADDAKTKLLKKKWFRDYRKYFHEASFFGHSLVQFIEMVPSKEPGLQFEFKKVELINREHVRPEDGFIVLDTSHETGIPFRDAQFKSTLKLMECGDPNFLGLLQVAVKEYIWKNYSRSDWSRHSEKFGMPMLAIKAATRNDAELDKLEQMASEFGQNLYMILDPEDEVDLKQPESKDSFQIYKELAMFANTEISKAISGATGTSDEKAFVGSAQVHEEILNEFVEEAKRDEADHINEELFPFLIENGYPLDGYEYRYLEYQGDPNAQDENDVNGNGNNPKPKGDGGSPAKKKQASLAQNLLR